MSTRYGRPPEPPTYQPPGTVQAGQPQTVQAQSQESGKNETVDVINEKLQSGARLSTRETAFMARYYPEQALRYASTMRLNQKFSSGERLTTRETAYFAKNYPSEAKQYAASRFPVAASEAKEKQIAGGAKSGSLNTLTGYAETLLAGRASRGVAWPAPKPAQSTVSAKSTLPWVPEVVQRVGVVGNLFTRKATGVPMQLAESAMGLPVTPTPDFFSPSVPLQTKIQYLASSTVFLVGSELLISQGISAASRAAAKVPNVLQEKIMPRGGELEHKVADWAYGGIEGGFERTASDELLRGKATVFLEKASANIRGVLPDLKGYMRQRIGPVAQATVDYPTVMEGGAAFTGKQLVQDLPKYVAGVDMFDWTVSPKTSGYGATMPPAIATTVVNPLKFSKAITTLLTTGEMVGLEQFQRESLQEQKLSFKNGKPDVSQPYERVAGVGSFEKVPYRMDYSGKFGFEKQLLGPKTTLLRVAEEYSPKQLPSGPMENYMVNTAKTGGQSSVVVAVARNVPVGAPESFQRGAVESLIGGAGGQAFVGSSMVGYVGKAYPGTVRRERVETVEEEYAGFPTGKLAASARFGFDFGLGSLSKASVKQGSGVASGFGLDSVLRAYLGVSESMGLASYSDQGSMLVQAQKQVQLQEYRQVQTRQPQSHIQQAQSFQGFPMPDSESMMRKLLGEKPVRVKRVRVGRYQRDWVNWTPQQMLKRMVGTGHVGKRKKV